MIVEKEKLLWILSSFVIDNNDFFLGDSSLKILKNIYGVNVLHPNWILKKRHVGNV